MLVVLLHLPGEAMGIHPSGADRVTLSWDPNPVADEVIGYRIYYGTASRNYTNVVLVENGTSFQITGLESGVTYYFAVTAYNAIGLESDFSDELSYQSGLPRLRIRVTATHEVMLTLSGLNGHRYIVEATQDFWSWTVIGQTILGASGTVEISDTSAANYPRRFYRMVEIPL